MILVVLKAIQKVTTKVKLEKVTDAVCLEKGIKTESAGTFDLNSNAQQGEDFIRPLTIEDLDLRSNLILYTTRSRTTNDSILRIKTVKTSVYVSIVTMSHCMIKLL